MRKRASAVEARIAELEAANATLAQERDSFARQRDALAEELASTHARAVEAERERDLLRASHERLRQELELLKKRLFVAKAERVDTTQLELEFAAKLRELEEVAGTLAMHEDEERKRRRKRAKPKGRRDLSELDLPKERVELTDPVFEALVAEGKATRHGFEVSHRLMRQRGGMRVVEVARAKYKRFDEAKGETVVTTTPRPKDLLDGSIATASLAAHVIEQKVGKGMPLHRLEEGFTHEGAPFDRATMSRMLEELGASFGASLVRAMRDDAMAKSFCIATDATGLKIQPVPRADGKRQACKNAHFLVLVADRDHVFFDYLERETSAAIAASFEGFSGYVQADAKSVYDILFRWRAPPESGDADDDEVRCREVGCWAHARRKFWEATAVAKSEVAKEGLARIGRIFELERMWASMHVRKRHRLRQKHLRVHVEDFFRWNAAELAKTPERGLLRTALNYADRQQRALARFLEDARLVLDNNRSERALRKVAVGRKAWLFAGSDAHAQSLSHLFTLEASARLHGLDPEAYFRDLIRVLPYWPRERYLELCPRDWARTRARIDPDQLAPELGPITVPPVARA